MDKNVSARECLDKEKPQNDNDRHGKLLLTELVF